MLSVVAYCFCAVNTTFLLLVIVHFYSVSRPIDGLGAFCFGLFAELSMGWVDPRVGLGWVGIFYFLVRLVGLLGWVHYSKSTKILKGLYVSAFKGRFDKIWLHQSVVVGCVGSAS